MASPTSRRWPGWWGRCESAHPSADALACGSSSSRFNRFEADFIHSARDGLALLERVGYDHVGLILDTFHMNIEEPSIEESMRLVGPRLFHFHLSDSNRWHPGAGHIDFARVVRILADMGYDGFLSGEFMAKPDAETAAQRMIEHMRLLLPAGERVG